MNDRDIYMRLKKAGLGNSEANTVALAIWKDIQAHVKGVLKLEKKEQKAQTDDEALAKLLENPLSQEEEAKYLRALLHKGLVKGEVNPQLLEKLDKIIGVSSGEDEQIEVVEFKDAFPSLAKAIEWCHKPRPEGVC